MEKVKSDKLKQILNCLDLDDLSKIHGSEILTGLSEIGLPITKSHLIEMLFASKGVSFLLDKTYRKIIFSKPAVIVMLGILPQLAKKIINSPWSQNYNIVANLLDVSVEDLEPIPSSRSGDFTVDGTRSLMPYQNWMRKRVFDFFARKNGARTLVHMPTGAGKTSTAMQILFDQIRMRSPENTTIVWMAHSDELCEQAVQSFDQSWPAQQISSAKVWRAWGGQSDFSDYDAEGCNFVVTSFQTLHSWMRSADNTRFETITRLKMNADFLIIDEAHLSTAPTFRSVIDYVAGNNTNILGLTATPGRHRIDDDTQETEDLVGFFNGNLLSMTKDDGTETNDPIGFLQSKGVLSKVIHDTLPGSNVSLSPNEITACANELELPELVLKRLGEDSRRTLNVARKTLELARIQGKQTIVFCPSKANAQLLAEYLKINECSAAAITGDLPMSQRKSSLEKFKSGELKIITNYNVLTTGFDAPNIEAVVIARPTLSVVLYSQMIGRGIRGPLFGGTHSTTIVNVEDNIANLPDFRSAFTYFNKFF